jgi:hypothetical protein
MTSSTKKPVIVFSACDDANFPHAVRMFNSLTKFHPDVDMVLWTTMKNSEQLKKLPSKVVVEDLSPLIEADSMFFYRQKPVLAKKYIKSYDLVLGLDSDQIITGNLTYIFETKDYDVGTVLNWNRIDPQRYGIVAGWGIAPAEYFNCGLVAMRSEAFVHHWEVLCFTPQFDRLQYKEQDLLNILSYYGNYNVRCFDHGDKLAKMSSWWGLIAKGEYANAKLINDEIVIEKGQGDKPFPPADMIIKVIHFAGGNDAAKGNYRLMFNDDIVKKLDFLVSPTV